MGKQVQHCLSGPCGCGCIQIQVTSKAALEIKYYSALVPSIIIPEYGLAARVKIYIHFAYKRVLYRLVWYGAHVTIYIGLDVHPLSIQFISPYLVVSRRLLQLETLQFVVTRNLITSPKPSFIVSHHIKPILSALPSLLLRWKTSNSEACHKPPVTT